MISRLNDVLEVTENKIFTKLFCQINIDKKEYKDFLVEYDSRYQIPGVVDIYFPELEDFTQVITPYVSIGLIKNNTVSETSSNILINYEPGELIIEQDYVNSNINLPLITKMLEGKLQYIKNPVILLNLLNISLPKSDLVHFEVILSNIFRDNETKLPCRFTGDYSNSTQIGVMKLAKTDSWLSAIAFQNIDQGINRALVEGKPAKMNPLEKVLNEEFNSL